MPFKLRLSASEWRFALRSFAAKVVLFWLSELVICQWDLERWVCNVVGKGFIPCLITFALMDLLVIPQIRRLRNQETAEIHNLGLKGGPITSINRCSQAQA